jgi:hypothetical protein
MGLNSFLKFVRLKFSAVLKKQLAKEKALANSTGQYTTLSRFIFRSGDFNRSQNRPKPSAFLPPPDLRTSAFWIDQLSEPEVWWIGDNVAAGVRGSPSARADITASTVFDTGLKIEPDPTPHPRHIDICGWPPEKDKQKSIALDLCAFALLRLR